MPYQPPLPKSTNNHQIGGKEVTGVIVLHFTEVQYNSDGSSQVLRSWSSYPKPVKKEEPKPEPVTTVKGGDVYEL